MPQRKIIDPRKQFSKWLARYGAIVWGLYIFAIIALIAYRPETAMACVWLTLIMTFNKALDTLSYTDNSKTEKILLAALDKTSMELKLGSNKISSSEGSEEIDETEEGESEG